MAHTIDIDAFWDSEAGVWVAEAETIGLVTEAAAVDELRAKLPAMAADLLADDLPAGTEIRVRLHLDLEESAFTPAA